MKKVKDVVNRNLITVSPSSSFEEVINIMKKGVGKVPVLENEKVVGIITREEGTVQRFGHGTVGAGLAGVSDFAFGFEHLTVSFRTGFGGYIE